MNLKQANYICAIAREGGVTAAAQKLHISQPSLSQTLRQVEEELGLPLFDRSVSPVRPTYAGEKYIRAAETILAVSERLEEQLREIRGERSGRLRLGISVQRAMQVLPGVMPRFRALYPDVSVELTEEGSARLEELLRQGQIDLALAALESTSHGLVYELIEKETIGVLAGADTLLARTHPDGSAVSLTEAAGESFVVLKEGHSVRVVQDKLFRKYGLMPHILLETDSLEVARRVALDAGACMLCSNIFVDELVRRRRGAFFPLRDYENHRHFYACCRKDDPLPKYSRDLIRLLSKALNHA